MKTLDPEIQKQLDQLKKIKAGNKARATKYLAKRKAEGKRPISAILDAEAYNELTRRRDASVKAGMPLSLGEVISAALLKDAKPEPVKVAVKDTVKVAIPESTAKTDNIPDCHGKDLTLQERDAILIQVGELYPGRKDAQRRADALNKAGVPIKGATGQWNPKNAGDNIRLAKKRR